MQDSVSLLISGKRAQGTVVGMKSTKPSKSMSDTTPLLQPTIEFTTSTGEIIRVNGRSHSETASVQTGDKVDIAYSLTNPKNAQILTWNEFPIGPVGSILGLTIFIILIWFSSILISDDPGLDDPLHILSSIITRVKPNPVRFSVSFILSIVIPACGLLTFSSSQKAIELHFHGAKTIGNVVGMQVRKSGSSARGGSSMFSSQYPEIAFEDLAGKSYMILGASKGGLLAHTLNIGDRVEVIYLESQPEQGMVNAWDELWLIPLVYGIFTLLSLIALRLVFVSSSIS